MADTKTSDLAAVNAVTDADLLYMVQSGVSKYSTIQTLRRWIPHTPTAVFGDGNAAANCVAGLKCYVRVPYGGTIVEWSLVANTACTCVLDVWKAAGAVPSVANAITGASTKPQLNNTAVGGSTTLTGWTTTVTAGDVLGFRLDSVSGGPTLITLTLKVV